VRETAEELNDLQALLDVSLSRSTTHLRSIITERTMTAQQLTQILTGMCTLALSTVTAKGEPRISGVDGHFLHGKWYFGTAQPRQGPPPRRPPRRQRRAHARRRPGRVHARHGGDPQPRGRRAGCGLARPARVPQGFYGDDAFDWDNDVVFYRLHPYWMTVYAPDVAKLTGM
jgi:hypothetical protein